MRTITQITEHPRKPGRYVVEVDRKQVAVVTADALAATKAQVGVVVDETLAAHLNEANELTTAYDRALNLLTFRARSARELHRRLVQKGVTAARADRVITKLREVGLIDDADFARQLTRSKLAAGASQRRVHQELFKRGVPREVADEAVEQVVEEEGMSDAESIERIARKKWRTLSSVDELTRRRRLFAFLARRGFDSDDVSRVVRQFSQETAEEGE